MPLMFEAGIELLPTETLVSIVLELDWKSICHVRLLNKHFRSIVDTHARIQYQLELSTLGMIDGQPHNGWTTEERLSRLRQHRESWKTLRWKQRKRLKVPSGPIWELSSGVLGQGSASLEGRWHVRSLFFTRLPAISRNIKPSQWIHKDFEEDIRDFTFDPTQDLLVLLCNGSGSDEDVEAPLIRLHFRALSTNAKHPAARQPVVTSELSSELTVRCTYSIQVCQSLVGVLCSALFEEEMEQLVLWNWRTGQMLFKLQQCYIMSYAFLTDRHLLLAVSQGSDRPIRQGDDQVRLVVCDIEGTAHIDHESNPTSYAAICELHFPPFEGMSEVVSVLIRADPPGGPFPRFGETPKVSQRDRSTTSFIPTLNDKEDMKPVPFEVAPFNRVIVVTLAIFPAFPTFQPPGAAEYYSVAFFIPFSTFLPHLAETSVSEIITPDTRRFTSDQCMSLPMRRIAVKWNEWVPHGSRVLLLPSEEQVWVCNVYGSRFIYPVEGRRDLRVNTARSFAVLDFNALSLRRFPSTSKDGMESDGSDADNEERPLLPLQEGEMADEDQSAIDASVTDIHEPSTIEASKYSIFREDVTSSLPYRRTVTNKTFTFDGVMLTEDNVVLVKRRTAKEYEILTF